MKRIAILAAIALSATAAHADPVTVETPAAPITAEAAQQYVIKLERAVKDVCFEGTRPIVGMGLQNYRDCITATRADVARQDPTGLYGKRESLGSTILAAK